VPYARRSFAATGCRTPTGCSPRGKAAFKAVCDLDLEGIVAKRLADPYSAARSAKAGLALQSRLTDDL
jgi:ATP-dependent DNA ligase